MAAAGRRHLSDRGRVSSEKAPHTAETNDLWESNSPYSLLPVWPWLAEGCERWAGGFQLAAWQVGLDGLHREAGLEEGEAGQRDEVFGHEVFVGGQVGDGDKCLVVG